MLTTQRPLLEHGTSLLYGTKVVLASLAFGQGVPGAIPAEQGCVPGPKTLTTREPVMKNR